MYYKFIWRKLGGHIHLSVFSAPHPDQTYAKSGELIFREGADWIEFQGLFKDGSSVVWEER